MNPQKIRNGIIQVLDGLGLDLDDPNLVDTPDRMTRAYQEICAGLLVDIDYQVEKFLESTFPCDNQQMIVATGIEVFSVCPHHFLPVRYDIKIGYLPGSQGGARALGLSKLARLAKLLAARPILQEQVVTDIVQALMRIPGCVGAGCVARGEHYCMRMRGVAQSGSIVTTSDLRGLFLEDPMVRAEFMQLIK
jgi:GTP cyclohydrolase IA